MPRKHFSLDLSDVMRWHPALFNKPGHEEKMNWYDWRISKSFLSMVLISFIVWMGWTLGNQTYLSMWRRLEPVD